MLHRAIQAERSHLDEPFVRSLIERIAPKESVADLGGWCSLNVHLPSAQYQCRDSVSLLSGRAFMVLRNHRAVTDAVLVR